MVNVNAVAVIVELLGYGGDPVRYTVADGAGIPKGTLMKMTDPRTMVVSAADNDPFAGIAAVEKVASDGSTTLACYTHGIFDIEQLTGVTSVAGERVSLAGANIVSKVANADMLFSTVGIALEDAAAEEIFACLIGSGF